MLAEQLIGFSCCAVAGVGFAVNYIPVKRMDTGDGVFFAAAMSLGIVMVGVVTGIVTGPFLALPKFEPLAALGGCIWMLGNLMCPYIIRLVGLGLGLTVWDLSNMITGWFTGFFGLFGVHREMVSRVDLNCLGVSLAAVSLLFFSLAAIADLPKQEQGTPSHVGEDCLKGFERCCVLYARLQSTGLRGCLNSERLFCAIMLQTERIIQ